MSADDLRAERAARQGADASWAHDNEHHEGEYGEIAVLDNPLPPWWKWLFIGTIVLSFPYFAYYHFGAPGRSLEDSYTLAVAENAQLQFAEIGELTGDTETLVRYLDEPQWLSVGKSVYRSNCIACHGADGGGLVGPNLTDDQYKNVRSITDIYHVVNTGAAGGAMPPWQNRLDQNERVLVSAYVASLRGTTPGGSAKGPEGAEIPPWPSLEDVQAASREEAASEAAGGADGEAAGGADGEASAGAAAGATDSGAEAESAAEAVEGTPDAGNDGTAAETPMES